MTLIENAIVKIADKIRKDPEMTEAFLKDEKKRHACMERLLDTECGAEVEGIYVRFDLGCAQPVAPYAELEKAVLDALDK